MSGSPPSTLQQQEDDKTLSFRHCPKIQKAVNLVSQLCYFSLICATSWPKTLFYADFRRFAPILGIFMLITCIFTRFCTYLSKAERTFVLIYTLFACLKLSLLPSASNLCIKKISKSKSIWEGRSPNLGTAQTKGCFF